MRIVKLSICTIYVLFENIAHVARGESQREDGAVRCDDLEYSSNKYKPFPTAVY